MMNRHFKTGLPLLICLFLVITATDSRAMRHQVVITGRTMGTFYTVKFISKKKENRTAWKKRIEMQLRQVNQAMSMYDPKSELSDFNRHPAGEDFRASTRLYALISQSRELYTLTGGAWDGTVKPLVDLWGFGTRTRQTPVPAPEVIEQTRSETGFSKIVLLPSKTIRKTAPVTLDLGSIAKGFGVDAVKKMMNGFGVTDCLVEIGGELSASGKNRRHQYWTVGINRPENRDKGPSVYRIIQIENRAVATSGNYRNFFIHEGRRYSHIIDPRTGWPVDNRIVSATVVNASCAFADGLATALMILPTDQGIALVNRLEDTECLIIEKNAENFRPVESKNFHRLYFRP